MVDIRIVCARDAVKTAEMLRRLLEAEQHSVDVSFGRHSLDQFEHARDAGEVVLLIWSANAPGAHYMFEWAERFDRKYLVEIASAVGWPDLKRAMPVIDFVNWNGTRGSKAWVALIERLKPFSRVRAIKVPPPRRAAMALGFAAAAAVMGAMVVRVQAGVGTDAAPTPTPEALHVNASAGVGGPEERSAADAVEPPSIEDIPVVMPHRALAHVLHSDADLEIVDLLDAGAVPAIRPPTLLERLGEFNPLQPHPTQND